MSVREDPTLYLQPGQGRVTAGTVMGGNATTSARPHRLDGPEHTAADDTTALDSSATRHGLLPKLSGDPSDALLGDGSWGPVSAAADAELNIEGGQSVIKAHGSMGATETFDPTDGNVHTGTLDANVTVTLNAPSGTGFASLELWLTEDGTGGWTVTWPGSVTEVGTHDTTAGTMQRVILETVDGGTSWIATWIGASSGGTPATTVESETTFGITPAVGTDTEYARQDHTHGTPANPISEAGIRDVGHWEVVVSGSAPPVAVSTPSDDDWVFAWVPG